MIALLQRVTRADVSIDAEQVAEIAQGLLVFIGVEPEDRERDADRLLERLLGYRVFEDNNGKMNLSLTDIGGGLLLVPQFTLAADTNKGMRPGFTGAASPEAGKTLFDYLVEKVHQQHKDVQCGQFGADMKVSLTNDGPVTFLLQTRH